MPWPKIVSKKNFFWKMGFPTSILGVLFIVGSILLDVFDKASKRSTGLMLFFGILFLVGGITGGVWVLVKK
jgi:hypothetical protein